MRSQQIYIIQEHGPKIILWIPDLFTIRAEANRLLQYEIEESSEVLSLKKDVIIFPRKRLKGFLTNLPA